MIPAERDEAISHVLSDKVPDSEFEIELQKKCATAMLDIVGSIEDLELASHILSSSRRIARMYGQGDSYTARQKEICDDLRSFQGIETSEEAVGEMVKKFGLLELAYFPVITTRVRRVAGIVEAEMGATPGFDDLHAFGESLIHKAIWHYWNPETTNHLAFARSLHEKVIVNASFFARAAVRHYKRDQRYNTVDSLDAFDEGYNRPWEDWLTDGTDPYEDIDPYDESKATYDVDEQAIYSVDALSEKKTLAISMYETTRAFREVVGDLLPSQIMEVVSRIAPRFQLAILFKFGYLGFNTTRNYARERNTLESTINTDYKRGVKRVIALLDNFENSVAPTATIREVIDRAQEARIYRMGNRVLHYDSPRISLVDFRDDSEFLNKLSDIEHFVVKTATEVEEDGVTFRNANEAVAKATDGRLTARTIETYLKRLEGIALSDTSRFMGQDNVAIREISLQHRLIISRQTVTPYQLAMMIPEQQDAYYFLTTPDENGRYPRQERFLEQNRNRWFVIGGIQESLESTEAAELARKFELCLQYPEQFQDHHIRMMQDILALIRSGTPLRSPNGGIGYQVIGDHLGFERFTISSFINDLLPRALVRIAENRVNNARRTRPRKVKLNIPILVDFIS